MSIKVYVLRRKDRHDYQLAHVDPVTRRRHTRTAATSDLKTARLAAARWQAEIEQGGAVGGRTSWEVFRNRFKDEHLITLAPKTRKAYLTALNHFESLIGKPVSMNLVDAGLLSKFKAKLLNTSIVTTTVRSYLNFVICALSWAKSVNIIKVAPKIKLPKLQQDEKAMSGRPITDEEFETLIAAVKEVRPDDHVVYEHFIRGLRLSGLRIDEAEKLDWERGPVKLDLDGGRHPRILLGVEGHKGRRNEILPVTPDFAEFIATTPILERKGCVFKVGTKARRVVAEIGRASGVVVSESDGVQTFVSAKYLRKTFATYWSYRVRPIILQRLMRHKDIKTTLKFYVAQEADDVGDELQRAYQNSENVHQNVHQSTKKTKGRPKNNAKNAGKNGDFG
jgi:integrase